MYYESSVESLDAVGRKAFRAIWGDALEFADLRSATFVRIRFAEESIQSLVGTL